MRETINAFRLTDDFLGRYARLVREVVVPYQERALRDEIPGVEKSHAVENFRKAAQMLETGRCDGDFYGMVFQDSDVAKWLEAAAYALKSQPDAELEARCDALIDLIGRAQQEDGYLNTYFTVKEPARRWTNLQEAHELYCAGHMIEAAVAYAQSTGKRKLLFIMCRMADHIYEHFMVKKAEGYPGHPEIELALIRLYRATGNAKYLALAGHFVNARGVDADYFAKEARRRGWCVWGMGADDREYAQNHVPVREMDKAVGHAVRAVYLYAGMAGMAAETREPALMDACDKLWDNITTRRMYITGAIGSCYEGEAFTRDYHLPNDSAYAETCAAIGLVFFARAMTALKTDGGYADVMERALYNCVLAGMALDGERFFYVNPLEVTPGISGEARPLRHALPQRPGWFGCACCPPNVARLLLSIGGYAWSETGDTVFSHLFISGELDLVQTKGGKIHVGTAYPSDGSVRYAFAPEHTEMRMTLAIRLPAWSEDTQIFLNGKKVDSRVENGYAYLERAFTASDTVELRLDMRPRRVFANPAVAANSGRVAFMRGPLVYCAEGVDNGGGALDLLVKKEAEPVVCPFDPGKLGGCAEMTVKGYRLTKTTVLYAATRPKAEACTLRLIPYYAWGNRGETQMRVWIPEAEYDT